ncbi:hypothetical protein C7974DRAFT_380630 [Boeremia exigua]|uniref:uncharacterized protein n=1 Tax=Boeremia exigua TaxID=749465 RepID=UPI001E8D28CD|nr:uncharacterized protein C7974DRAFT_380630 [Boeremia exigua]KAH6614289.1 hypothetical protein C7974DRAFT_380630 [Boeremia exigua]
MTVQESYTLGDFENYARKEFPVAFKTVANPELYSFLSRRFSTDPGGTQESAVLYIAFSYSEKLDIRVWAHSNGTKVQYFYEEPGTPLMSNSPPYQNEGLTVVNTFQGPFARVHSSMKLKLKKVRALARKKFSFLVQLAFLVTGHIDSVGNPDRLDLLMELKDLCIHLHSNKVAEESVVQSGSVIMKEEKLRTDSAGAVSPILEFGWPASSVSHNDPGRNAGVVFRSVNQPLPSQEDANIDLDMQPVRKRKRAGSSFESVSSAEREKPSPQLQGIFETLVGGCKAEAEGRWAQEKEAFLQQIHELKSQLRQEEEGTRKAEVESGEWKEKYVKLKEKLARLMGDD